MKPQTPHKRGFLCLEIAVATALTKMALENFFKPVTYCLHTPGSEKIFCLALTLLATPSAQSND